MVRIAGIDRDVSPLELVWHQSDENDKLNLALTYIIEVSQAVVDGKMTIEMQDDKKYVIQVTEEKVS